ncbi:MAG: DUF4854 domain-containing protein [Clostridia bacterium]|nr:DUF4854 domain-containing protein [Clostridia bacterium]
MKRSCILALCAAILISAAACSNDPAADPTAAPTAEATIEASSTPEVTAEPTEEPTAEPTEEPTEEPTAEPTEEPTAEPSGEPMSDEQIAAKVSEYTEAVNAQYATLSDFFAAQGMSCVAKAEGADCVTEYTYLQQVEFDAEQITAALDEKWSTYKAMYDELKTFVGSEDVRVILRYVNFDGTKLLDYVVDKTYHAE